MERYQRQITLKQLGEKGQEKISSAKVLIIGVGGLGCPVLLYLAAAGVGTMGIVDQDKVSLSNLQRQVLYTMTDIGLSKVEQAKHHIAQLNSEISIITHDTFLTTTNAEQIISAYDIIVDATDNFPARYLINDACYLLKKPLVYGAVSDFEGQVAVFNVLSEDGSMSANYRDIFPVPPRDGEIGNCAEVGVLGILPGMVGCLQANEVIKLITGIGKPLINKLQTLQMLSNEWQIFNIVPLDRTHSLIPKNFLELRAKEYALDCDTITSLLIDNQYFDQLINQNDTLIIDIREQEESPEIHTFEHTKWPLSQWDTTTLNIDVNTIIIFCQSGKRSKKALSQMALKYPDKTIFSLKNGIIDWIKNKNNE